MFHTEVLLWTSTQNVHAQCLFLQDLVRIKYPLINLCWKRLQGRSSLLTKPGMSHFKSLWQCNCCSGSAARHSTVTQMQTPLSITPFQIWQISEQFSPEFKRIISIGSLPKPRSTHDYFGECCAPHAMIFRVHPGAFKHYQSEGRKGVV